MFDKCPVIGVNDAFRVGDWVDICFFGDVKWYWWNKEDLKAFKGLKVTCDRQRNPAKIKAGERYGSVKGEPDIRIVRHSNSHGIGTEKFKVRFNSSSGAAAINLAWYLGVKRVVLVGFDMRVVDNMRNWRPHPDYKPGTQKGYKNFLKPFDQIERDAHKLGFEILNATPGSGLKKFPFIDLESLCKLWTSTKLFIIYLLTEQASLDMVMESLSFV